MTMPVANREILLKLLDSNKEEIKFYGVKKLSIFGSFAKDDDIDSNSDVDLLVEFEAGRKTLDNFIELALYLEDIFARRVELVTLQSLSKYLGPHILTQVRNVEL